MAITKIHAIKVSVSKAVSYICDDQKLSDPALISSFATTPESASFDFRYALSYTNQNSNLSPAKAFHLIQSFAPGEVQPEEAHKIGEELADKLLEGQYSYIVTTHTDHDHIHNHIIFCAADNIDHRKYHDCKESYRKIRMISDELCKEHNLSILADKKQGGKQYKEWSEEKNGQSWKALLKSAINEAIQHAGSYEEFIFLMREKGYEIKDEGFESSDHKYIAFRAPGQERWTRGREKSLGAEFTKERIEERIENRTSTDERTVKTDDAVMDTDSRQNNHHNTAVQNVNDHRGHNDHNDKKNDQFTEIKTLKIPADQTKLIDTSQAKFADNPYLKTWAEKKNLKTAAQIFSKLSELGLQSIPDLDSKIKELHDQTARGRKKVVEIDRQLKELREIIAAAKRYSDNQKDLKNYAKSKDKERYYQNHHYELHVAWGAEEILKGKRVDPAKIDLKKLQKKHDKMTSDRAELISEYRSAEKQCNKLTKLCNGLDAFMNDDISKIKERDKKQSL